MTKKLVKHGKSLALIITKPMLDALNITEETPLQVSVENNLLIIKPMQKKTNTAKKKPEFRELAQKVMDKYDPVFKKLAKEEKETLRIGRTIMKELDPVFRRLSKV